MQGGGAENEPSDDGDEVTRRGLLRVQGKAVQMTHWRETFLLKGSSVIYVDA